MSRPKESRSDYRRDFARLQESLAGRTSHYIEEIGDLIQRRSLEPKEWLSGYSEFWKNVIGDVGDWMQYLAGENLRPTGEWVQRFSQHVPRARRQMTINVDVPDEAFGTDHKSITLVTDGLSRGNQSIIIEPKDIEIRPPRVKRSERRSVRMTFRNLDTLRAGIYSGIICADETDLTVAIVELIKA